MKWLAFLLVVPLAILLLPACMTVKLSLWPDMTPDDIPNFAQVDQGVYRGGQPTEAGWKKLRRLGVTKVVKLNSDNEGSDDGSEMVVHKYTITVEQQLDPFYPVSQATIREAVADIGPGTFVHCGSDARTQSWLDKKLNIQGGQDRTGLIIACYRLTTGWTVAAAQSEMRSRGFHWFELPGLEEAWKTFAKYYRKD
jgi:hypothetical protein